MPAMVHLTQCHLKKKKKKFGSDMNYFNTKTLERFWFLEPYVFPRDSHTRKKNGIFSPTCTWQCCDNGFTLEALHFCFTLISLSVWKCTCWAWPHRCLSRNAPAEYFGFWIKCVWTPSFLTADIFFFVTKKSDSDLSFRMLSLCKKWCVLSNTGRSDVTFIIDVLLGPC